MLTQNPKVRKELNHLSDSADSAIRHIKHAARDSREAAAPLSLDGLIRDERGIRYAPEASD